MFILLMPEYSVLVSLPETNHPIHQNKNSKSRFLRASVWVQGDLTTISTFPTELNISH